MRTSQKANRSRLIEAAMQKVFCDLTIENINFVNMFTGEVYPASVDVLDGTVVRVRINGEETSQQSKKTYDGRGAYLIPGFIDTHMHVESTMMLPENVGRAIVPWGTTTVCTDPHEIGNVMGVEGVRFMLENGKRSALRHYVLAPSCVPAVPKFEKSGAVFTAKEVGELLDMPDVVGIAEIMDFVGVYEDSDRMHSIIDEGIKRGVYLQAHAPLLSGKELAAYCIGGPKGDHESTTSIEVREKLRNGMHINLRASSLADDLKCLLDGLEAYKFRDFISVCTDDVHAADLLTTGHVNQVVKKMIQLGLEPIEAIRFATLNAAREYGFDDLGAIAPGYLADMQLVRELDGGKPEAVFIMGELVAKDGVYLMADTNESLRNFPNTVNTPQITSSEDFMLRAPEGCGGTVEVAVISPIGKSPILNEIEWIELPVKDGRISIEGRDELCFVCVANRYGNGGSTIAVMKNRKLKSGAYGTTISHDSHNLTILYKDATDAFCVAEALKREGGGICVAVNDAVDTLLPLPVAGLMSALPVGPLSEKIDEMEAAVQRVCGEGTSLLHASVLALPCLPSVVITDFGIVDVVNQCIVEELKAT